MPIPAGPCQRISDPNSLAPHLAFAAGPLRATSPPSNNNKSDFSSPRPFLGFPLQSRACQVCTSGADPPRSVTLSIIRPVLIRDWLVDRPAGPRPLVYPYHTHFPHDSLFLPPLPPAIPCGVPRSHHACHWHGWGHWFGILSAGLSGCFVWPESPETCTAPHHNVVPGAGLIFPLHATDTPIPPVLYHTTAPYCLPRPGPASFI